MVQKKKAAAAKKTGAKKGTKTEAKKIILPEQVLQQVEDYKDKYLRQVAEQRMEQHVLRYLSFDG